MSEYIRSNIWIVYACLSALCAAVIPILGKRGMETVDSNLATGARSIAQMAFVVVVCLCLGLGSKVKSLAGTPLLLVTLTGIAGGASWLFYFAAVRSGPVSKVAPIDKLSMPLAVVLAVLFLGERPSLVNIAGLALIVAGVMLAIYSPAKA